MKKVLFILIAICLCILLWLALKPTEQDPEVTSPSFKPQIIERTPSNLETLEPSTKGTIPQATFTLDESDNAVRPFIKENASSLVNWLAPNELIRRFVINVSALSQGNTPSDHPLITRKVAPFTASKDSSTGRLTVAPSNAERLSPLVRIITQIPPGTLVSFYQRNRALFEQAYQELGTQDKFNDRLLALLDRIIVCPPAKNNAILKQESVAFQYQLKQLENAKPLEKALWRLGNENLARLQSYSTKLKGVLTSTNVTP